MLLSSKLLTECGVLLLLMVLLTNGQNDTQPAAVFEEPPMDYIYGNLACESFNQHGSFCAPYLTGLGADIIVNYSRVRNQSDYTATANVLGGILNQIAHQKCMQLILPLLCRYIFVTCDPAYNTSVHQVYQPICRHGCDVVSLFACPVVWRLLQTQLSNLEFGVLDAPLCDPLDDASGGDVPDCTDTTDGGDIPEFAITTDCFRGRGRGYNGTINMTRSGKTCQHWSVQAPHRFILPSSQYPEIAGDHNYCRNPGSRGPEGPWCFTTDPNSRWEYCNVSQCDPTPSCELYQGTICYARGVIGKDYVFVDSRDDGIRVTDQEYWENALHSFIVSLTRTVESRGAPSFCVDEILSLMCFDTFPACDYGHSVSRPRQICRSYCTEISTGPCQEVWNSFQVFTTLQTLRLPNCSALPETNGGDDPECFIPFNSTLTTLPSDSPKTCYNEEDKGEYYDGNVNTTMSGKTCQAWDSDTPYFHPLTSLYRPYLEGHNYCRNPEGRGSQPWCYTTDPETRWEYCSIPRCMHEESTSDDDNVIDSDVITTIAIVIPTLIIVIVIIVLVAVIIHYRTKSHVSRKFAIANEYRDAKSVRQDVLRQSKFEMLEADNLNPSYIKHSEIKVTDYTDGVELNLPQYPRKDIVYISDLGQGNFGVVIKAEAKNIIAGEDSTTVAIKVLKEGASDQTKKDFFREAALMHEFNHPNILKLLGVCIEQEPLCMLFQYMEHGDLNSYLRKHNTRSTMKNVAQLSGSQIDLQGSLPVQLLVNMSINIAAGLEYLAQNHYIHRDLATRNCLIDSNFTVKIADFGLSQDIYATDYCRLGDSALLPIRWMPPEAIMYAKFTLQSDVWSFGVVLWEIFSYGAQPYFSLSNEEVVDYVRSGEVLKYPPGTPTELYDLMVDCWATDPEDRPTASELHVGLRRWNPDMSASISDTLSANNPKPYENMAAVKEMQRKKANTIKEQLSAQKLREGSAGSSDGSQMASDSSSSPTSDGDVAVPLNP